MKSELLQLQPTGSFDFSLALYYLKLSSSAILEKIDKGKYSRVLFFDDKPYLLTLSDTGNPSGGLTLLVQGEEMTPNVLTNASARMKAVFHLEKDPQPFMQSVSKDPMVQSLVTTYPGLRPILLAEPYESLLWAIIGQQINLTFAKKLKLRLIELCNCQVTLNGNEYLYLPTPEQIAALDPDLLQANQFSSQKTSYLLSTANAIVKGELDFEHLRQMNIRDAISYLTNFRGIGRWTAECILMRGIGFDDIFPAGDVGLQTITGQLYAKGTKMKESDLQSLSSEWKPWRSWAAFLWWNHLQTTIAAASGRPNQEVK